MKTQIDVIPYTPDLAERWDRFVEKESGNGTLFHTRRFLSYHPAGRFDDASVMLFSKGADGAEGELLAVVPTARTAAGFFSHPGTSTGGPVIRKDLWNSETLFPLLETIWNYYGGRWEMRIAEQHFSEQPIDPLLWFFGNRLEERSELVSVVDLIDDDPLNGLVHSRKKSSVRNIARHGISIAEAHSQTEYLRFHDILSLNLQKHGTAPVHTSAELTTLAELLKEKQQLWLARDDSGAVLAGCWVLRATSRCAHAQYIARTPEAPGSTVDALLVHAMREAKRSGAAFFSLGISTEEQGAKLNAGLFSFKEQLGARPTLRRIFTLAHSEEVVR